MKNIPQLMVLIIGLFGSLSMLGQATISGTVNTPLEDPICDVLVTLLDENGQTLDQEITSTNGTFAFADMPVNSSYSLRLEKEGNPLNGTSTFDMVVIIRGILGISPLDTYQVWAADVNNSGTVTALDLIFIRQIILAITSEFPVPPWLFGLSDSPSGSDWIDLGELTEDVSLDIIGVKTADMNYTAIPCN